MSQLLLRTMHHKRPLQDCKLALTSQGLPGSYFSEGCPTLTPLQKKPDHDGKGPTNIFKTNIKSDY